jgi:hypothetical protein
MRALNVLERILGYAFILAVGASAGFYYGDDSRRQKDAAEIYGFHVSEADEIVRDAVEARKTNSWSHEDQEALQILLAGRAVMKGFSCDMGRRGAFCQPTIAFDNSIGKPLLVTENTFYGHNEHDMPTTVYGVVYPAKSPQ